MTGLDWGKDDITPLVIGQGEGRIGQGRAGIKQEG